MIKEVKYSRTVYARAMSKSPNQAGIHIEDESWYSDKKNILLHSVNAKDGNITSHLYLQIPKENLGEVIEALKQFL